jgi:hypothetical protein
LVGGGGRAATDMARKLDRVVCVGQRSGIESCRVRRDHTRRVETPCAASWWREGARSRYAKPRVGSIVEQRWKFDGDAVDPDRTPHDSIPARKGVSRLVLPGECDSVDEQRGTTGLSNQIMGGFEEEYRCVASPCPDPTRPAANGQVSRGVGRPPRPDQRG